MLSQPKKPDHRIVWILIAILAAIACAVNTVQRPKRAAERSGRVAIRSPLPPAVPPKDLPPAAPAAPRPLGIALSPCHAAGCELTLTFSLPMIAADAHDAATPEVAIEPAQEGTWSWRSPSELTFQPAPGALDWGQDVTVTVRQATPLAGEELALRGPWRRSLRVPYLQVAGKVASWPIVRGRPRLIGVLNSFTGQIGAGPAFLLYDQPIDLEQVAERIEVRGPAGKTLAARIYQPESVSGTFDDEIDAAMLAAVRVTELPADGETVTLAAPDWLRDEEPRMGGVVASPLVTRGDRGGIQPRLVEYELTVNTWFGVKAVWATNRRQDGRMPLVARFRFELSNQFEIGRLREALRITPEPLGVEVARGGWAHVHVVARLEPGVRYRMTTGPDFTDVLGNRLTEGQGVDLDFRAQDQPPELSAPRLPVVVESGHPRLPLRGRNLDDLRATVWRFPSPQTFARALAEGRETSCRDDGEGPEAFRAEAPAELNRTATFDLPLEVGPGLFCVEVRARGRGSEAEGELHDAVVVQTTDLAITAKVFADTVFAWVTRLSDASPVAGAEVLLLDRHGKEIGAGTTSAPGTVELPAPGLATRTGLDQPLFLVATAGDDSAVVSLVDDHLSHAWQYGLRGVVRGAEKLNAVVFTDRGAYRPGETVHVKVILDASDAADLQLVIRDPRGQQVAGELLRPDRFGAADFDLTLKEQTPVGRYSVRATRGEAVGVRSFRVEEYRVPTFRVTVGDEGEPWHRGAEVDAVIAAEYLHGGVLDGRTVRWNVWRQPEVFAPPAFPRYVFQLGGDASVFKGSVADGEETLDGRGRLRVSFRAEHPSAAGPMRYAIEASVTDVDRQSYAGRLSRVVHPAAFYVGLLVPPRKVPAAGETLAVPIVAVRPEGRPQAGVRVRARLERIDYHTSARLAPSAEVQLLNRPVPVEQQQCLVTTAEAPVRCAFVLPEAGQYRIRAWAQDGDRRSVQAGFEIAASGDNPAAWPRFDQDRIEVVADQPRYRAGDVARLVVQTPYPQAQGLVTIERDRVLEHRLFSIDADTPALEVPITAAHAPNVYVSVILVRGRVHDLRDASGYETGVPGFKMGYVKLAVEPQEKRLAVAVRPAATIARPGEKLRLEIAVRDADGMPQAGQATVAVVDEAVLDLTAYRTPDPVAELYAERPLGVRTGESRHELPHARRARLEKIFPSGDGGRGFDLTDFPDQLRKLFKSTAYWNPNVPVAADGTAAVEIELPDNTTRYRIMAVVVGDQSRVGAGENRVVVRKPLMVQPVLPRFLYPDDELRIEALVFNGTPKVGEIRLAGEFAGLETIGPSPPSVRVEPGGQGAFPFRVRVAGREEASVRFAARLGDDADAVEVRIPILSPGTRRTVVASEPVADTGEVAVTLPAERLPGTVRVEVVTSTTVLSELKDAVQYLMRYPNGCIEQTTSTAYPLVVLRDLLPEIGVEVNEADLKKFSEAGIRRILSFQTPEGGLSYWPGSPQPHAFATAFGLTALIAGKKRGYEVPDEALEGMADYLEAVLRQGEISAEMPHGGMADGDTRALFVMTLGRLGRPQPGYVAALWRERRKLTPFGLAFLALAVKEMPGDQSLLDPILAEVARAARQDEDEAWYEGRRRGGWSFDSPLRTHAGSLLAFASSGGSAEMSGKLLTGLLNRRHGGLWGNTQENVFGIMGVHAAAAGTGGGAAPRMMLSWDRGPIRVEDMEEVSRRVRRLRLDESDLGLREGEARTVRFALTSRGGPPIFLTARAEYEVPLSEENRKARAEGFSLTRRYEALDGTSLEGRTIPLGSLVRVRLRVTTGEHRNYVAVDDRLPAGLEPLNTALETTERVDEEGELTALVQRSLSVLSYQEIRDSRVAFYVDDMLPGEYEFAYVARATTAGTFLRPAGRVEAMYEPEVAGRTPIDTVEVR